MTWIKTMGPLGFCVANIVLSALPVPGAGSTLCLLSGVMFGTLYGCVLYVLSGTAGAVLAFLLARQGRGFMTRALAKHAKLQRSLDRAVAKDGFQICLLMRLTPVTPGFQLTSYLLGLTSVGHADHLLGTLLGLFPCSFAYIYAGTIGANAGDIWSDPVQLGSTAVGVLVTVLVTVKIAGVAQKALADADEEK